MAVQETATWVNPQVLRWARERLNLSLQEVERESRKLQRRYYVPVSARELEQWEKSEGEPELAHLETLAEIYRCPVGYFFLERPPVERERFPVSFRGLEKDVSKLSSETLRTLHKFYEYAQWIADFIERFHVKWEVSIRPKQFEPDPKRVQEIVTSLPEYHLWRDERGQLKGDAEAAFEWWKDRIERKGVFVFQMKMDSQEARGAALWHRGLPFILVNRKHAEADTGRLFTLLHEFAHLLTSGEGIVCDFHENSSPEVFCNRFAAYMLLSPDDLRQRLEAMGLHAFRNTWSDRVLDKIRTPFMVSRDVVLLRLQEMGLAPPNLYERKRASWSKRQPWGRGGGGRPTKRVLKLRELGMPFARILAGYVQDPSFPWSDVTEILEMKRKSAEEFLQWVLQQPETT